MRGSEVGFASLSEVLGLEGLYGSCSCRSLDFLDCSFVTAATLPSFPFDQKVIVKDDP